MHEVDVRTRRRRENRIWRFAFLGSVLLHLFVLLLGGGRAIPFTEVAAAGPEAGDNRAAAGGLQVMSMVVPPPRPIERPIIPIPVEIEVEPIEYDMDRAFEESSFLGERPGTGAGIDTLDGAGNGGAASAGTGQNPMPAPKHMILPVDTPARLRGFDLTVWVFVTEQGEVVPDSTWLSPPSPDRRYNDRLISEAAEWSFRPAFRNGVAVAAWFRWVVKN